MYTLCVVLSVRVWFTSVQPLLELYSFMVKLQELLRDRYADFTLLRIRLTLCAR